MLTGKYVISSYEFEETEISQVFRVHQTPVPSIRPDQDVQSVLREQFKSELYNFTSIRASKTSYIQLDPMTKDKESLTK